MSLTHQQLVELALLERELPRGVRFETRAATRRTLYQLGYIDEWFHVTPAGRAEIQRALDTEQPENAPSAVERLTQALGNANYAIANSKAGGKYVLVKSLYDKWPAQWVAVGRFTPDATVMTLEEIARWIDLDSVVTLRPVA